MPTPLSGSREPDLTYLVDAADGARRRSCAPGSWWCSSRPPTPARPASELLPILERARACGSATDFHLAFSPERIDPGRTDYHRPHHAEAGRRHHRRLRRARPQPLHARSATRSSCSRPRRRRSCRSCWRTSSARSTSPSSTSSPSSATGSGSTSGRWSRRPPPSRSASCASTPARGWAATASRSTPSTSPSRRASTTSTPSSSSWPARSTRPSRPSACERIERALNEAGKPVNGSRILILGASYKAGIGDTRESPALKIIGRLHELGAEVSYHDPYVPELPELGLASAPTGQRASPSADLPRSSPPTPRSTTSASSPTAPLVIDFRGVTREIDADNLERL